MLQDPKILGKVARLEQTYHELRFVPLGTIPMEFAQTQAHFRKPPSDDQLPWKPIESGHGWGADYATGWFRGSLHVSKELAGQPLFLCAKTGGPETMLVVDGRAYGVFDRFHPVRLLALCAEPGHTHVVHLESYAGHTFPGTQPFEGPRSGETAGVLKPGSLTYECVEYGIERPEVIEFVNSVRALRQTALGLETTSLRRAKIVTCLGTVFALVPQKPAELDEEEWRDALRAANAAMKPLLAIGNGPTVPFLGVVGHSHIDTAWLWPMAETWRKCARTFSSVLSLMDQYPEFRFTSSAALHMEKIRELYPEIFERIKARVKEGRWEINGAMWIEPDCNIPSGEAFVRQCLYGQRATREMFGVTSDTLWQPDVFGYSAALPQILQKSGVEFFCTTKLSWNDTNRFPYDTFHWRGIDGTTVLAHFNEMQGYPYAENLINLWKNVLHMDVQDRRLVGFGHGDGGGGPMGEMIESLRLTQDLEGCPRTGYTSISEFMCACRDELHELPTWVGELYLELHRGTLTSISGIKKWNRRCEFMLQSAELFASLATLRLGRPYPRKALDDAWKTLLTNQFHDILPGSSIAPVNDEALATFAACHEEARRVEAVSLDALGGGTGNAAVVIGNTLSWARAGELVLTGIPAGKQPHAKGAVAQEFSDVEGVRRLAVSGLSVPALGYASFDLAAIGKAKSPFVVDGDQIQTPHAVVRCDQLGRIVSFYDRQAGRELVRTGGAFNEFRLGEDVPQMWDNWDIDRDQRHKMAAVTTPVTREIVSDGPLQLRVRFKRAFGRGSSLVQDMVFHAGSAQVDFDTFIEWHEKYQFLKVAFDLDVLADTALHEIQFGHVQRNAHDNTSQDRAQFDVCAHKWTDISENGFGVAFLNDSKYACTVKAGTYQLSLLKAGRHPDARGDEGPHRFTYALLPHSGGFSVETVVRPAYELNVLPSVRLTSVAVPPFGLAEVDRTNVIVAATKLAEEDGDLILRVYDAGKVGGLARIKVNLPIAKAMETNMLEEDVCPVDVKDDTVDIQVKPFEIKTVRFTLKG